MLLLVYFSFFLYTTKVAGQNPEVSTGIEIEIRRKLPPKPVETHRNPSKPIETHRNLSKSKGFDFCQNWIRVLPRNLIYDSYKAETYLKGFFNLLQTSQEFELMLMAFKAL